jgi:photosystem II stability/assembly factor-like uncharacterized protein
MQRRLLGSVTALLTFTVGLTTAILWKSAPQSAQPPATSVPTSRRNGLSILSLSARDDYQTQHDFYDIAFLPDGQMWACGFNGHNFGNLWHSTNSGLSWESRSVPPSAYSLAHLDFVDQLRGWAGGGRNVIIRTTDGGETWEEIKLIKKITGGITFDFINSKDGYVAAGTGYSLRSYSDERTFGIVILRTTDGGRTWHKVYEDSESGNIHMITAVSDRLVLAAIDGNYILRSENAGRRWKRIDLPSGGVSSIRVQDNGTLWAVGHGGGFYRSADQGKSWQRPTDFPSSLANRTWWDVGFIDSQLGLAVGDHGAFAITTDGGTSWAENPVGVNDDNISRIRLFGRGGIVMGQLNSYQLIVNDSQ